LKKSDGKSSRRAGDEFKMIFKKGDGEESSFNSYTGSEDEESSSAILSSA